MAESQLYSVCREATLYTSPGYGSATFESPKDAERALEKLSVQSASRRAITTSRSVRQAVGTLPPVILIKSPHKRGTVCHMYVRIA